MPVSSLPMATPASIVAEITIAIAISSTDEIAVPIASMTPEVVRGSRTTIGSSTIQTTVTCVMTVNKLFTLLIEM
jgi:hypothetical protein